MVTIPPPPQKPGAAAKIAELSTKASAGDQAAVAELTALEEAEKKRFRAIYFRPGDLKSELQVPLGATLPAGAPNAETITQAEAGEILQRVRSNLFTVEEQPQQGIILRPLAIG
jgi:hypothetical protein